MEEGLKYSFSNNINREGEHGFYHSTPNVTNMYKGTLPNLDQAPKGQLKPVMNDPVEKPRSLGKDL